MNRAIANLLVVVALGCGVVLIAITAGLFPAAEPDPVEVLPLVAPEARVLPTAAAAVRVMPEVSALSLCDLPATGARLEVGLLAAGPHALFVWCRGGYVLFDLDVTAGGPVLTKRVVLPTKMSRPGGAVIGDVSGDGVADLVVAVAPEEGLIHAPGSGVFLAKGRAQGGYEPAVPLFEMPVIALATAQVRAVPAPRDLFMLTRGDSAARRQGEVWWFETGVTLTKKRMFRAGFSPRDLRVTELATGPLPELLVATSEPGKLIRVDPVEQGELAPELPLPDVSQLCAAQDGRFVLARTTRDLWRAVGGDALSLAPWFRDANVGRCASGDLDGDTNLDALAVTDGGVIWLRAEGEEASSELDLPPGYQALDVAHVPGPGAFVMVLAADEAQGKLVSLTWPALPWADEGTLGFRVQPVREAVALAEIPLE